MTSLFFFVFFFVFFLFSFLLLKESTRPSPNGHSHELILRKLWDTCSVKTWSWHQKEMQQCSKDTNLNWNEGQVVLRWSPGVGELSSPPAAGLLPNVWNYRKKTRMKDDERKRYSGIGDKEQIRNIKVSFPFTWIYTAFPIWLCSQQALHTTNKDIGLILCQ